MTNTKIAVYPGTFDPITLGHLDVIQRSLNLFDTIFVAVTTNPLKKPLFTLEERIKLIEDSLKELGIKNSSVESFKGLLVDYAKSKNANVIIRGLRQVSDFEYEFQQASINRKLLPKVDTLFIMPSEKFFYLNSSMVRELVSLKGNVSEFVTKNVEEKLKEKFNI